jgi:hypothetical protein
VIDSPLGGTFILFITYNLFIYMDPTEQIPAKKVVVQKFKLAGGPNEGVTK